MTIGFESGLVNSAFIGLTKTPVSLTSPIPE